ncbi:hypothetical protein DSS3P1_74 [Ruegeria phage DSS3-P1]|uniref:hypothetical protein n=1 Tax=Ruegeria phage DSS3-P1 TaxID=1555208 RepID=UPI00051A9039|nr:hypothetical protein DSS3P1_74 [Ruegeria phage DSS3-P1]YP_009997291.1 hypothetical protein JT312_gp74 [Ruegeria phage vB_RpoS-V18]YP_009997373.1 hypothetical protein JT313_gp74 [Ruegeria phage vB_RpoS-V11]YP_009997457.1 hypothetical protein JT314_gp76 [Ruegeria phage vB_RpoS-V7]AIT13309.1 hypothetical protein DSS3P1_74 [Ruegeria phage DSS3-P1]AWY08779.1 hypothetical protein vBRpoSV7_76 [Ruegeria phage vB_RpoS-V7]AWY08950.1 hypothetical protein vBRpoSV18_74 [Ruegeria phage vB_RpoS-V18]AWY0
MTDATKFDPEEYGWKAVSFASDVDEDDCCSICGQDYAECPCPGPTMDDDWEYEFFDGTLYARRVEVIE